MFCVNNVFCVNMRKFHRKGIIVSVSLIPDLLLNFAAIIFRRMIKQ